MATDAETVDHVRRLVLELETRIETIEAVGRSVGLSPGQQERIDRYRRFLDDMAQILRDDDAAA